MDKGQEDNLAFLFSRMTWPSVIVRERACTSIAELLIDSEQASEIMEYLRNWARSQQLESVVVFALLALLRAKMLCQAFELPSLTEMLYLISKPSALSHVLLKELGYAEIPPPDWSSRCLSDSPKNFMPSNFFKKYCKNYLPPIYETHACRIEQKYDIPFYKHWAFEWKTILEVIDRRPSSEPLHFWGGPEYEHYEAIDFLLSEVYRSAYLRTLAWAISKSSFREEDATYFAIETCPIDPSLWKVQSVSKPQWWPTSGSLSGVIDTVVEDVWQKAGNLWRENEKTNNGWLIAQANGRVCQTDSVYDLEIRGVFQRCLGRKIPDLEEAFRQTEHTIPYVTTSGGVQGYIKCEPISAYAQWLDDWQLLPVACQVWPYTTPRWQSWRLTRGIWVLSPFLTNSFFQIKCRQDSLEILDGDEVVGKWLDWKWNFREKLTANLTPSSGEYLLIKRAKVEQFEETEKCKFCWICKLTMYYREHSYQEYKTHSWIKEYGSSSIIVG